MSLAEAAAALDRVLQHSSNLASSKYPPQLPPPPTSILPIPKVLSVSSVGSSRKTYQTHAGMEKNYYATTINPGEGFRMPVNSLTVKGDIPADFCGSRYSDARFQIVFSDTESKAYSNSMTSFRRSEFLNDFCKRPTKKDIFSSIPTFPFRDMVSRPYIRNCEFYQEREYKYRTLRPTNRDDMNYNDCFYNKERLETEWVTPRGDNFRSEWPASSESLTKFTKESRPFSDRCSLPDGNWQPQYDLQSRTSNKPFSSENDRRPLLRIMGPPSKFEGHLRSRSTSSLRSKFTRYEDFLADNDSSAAVIPISRSEMKRSEPATSTSGKVSVNSMTLHKVDIARPRIIKNSNQAISINTFVGNGKFFSKDRRRSKSLSVTARSSKDMCQQSHPKNDIEPVESINLAPSTVSGQCVLEEACYTKSLVPDDGHFKVPKDGGSASNSIMEPVVMDSTKNVTTDKGYTGPHTEKKACSKLSSLNFARGTSTGLAVLHPISYRTEPYVGSRTLLKHEPRITEKSLKQDECNYTSVGVTEVEVSDLKVAELESVQEDGVSLALEKDEGDENLWNFINFQQAEKSIRTPSSNKDLERQIVSSGLDCRSVNLNVSETWNSTLKNSVGLCSDISFSGNYAIEEHPDVIMNDMCKDLFECDAANAKLFDDPSTAEAVEHCLLPQEKNYVNGMPSDSLSLYDEDKVLEERDSNVDLTLQKGALNKAKIKENLSDRKLDFSQALDLLCSAKNMSRYIEEFRNSGNLDSARYDTALDKNDSLIHSHSIGCSSDMSDFLMNAEKNGLVSSSPKRSKHKISFAVTTCDGKEYRPGLNSCDIVGSRYKNGRQTSGGVCDEEVISCHPPATTTNNVRMSTELVDESKALLLGSKLCSVSQQKEIIREMISFEDEENSMKSKSSSMSVISTHKLDVDEVGGEIGGTNGVLFAGSVNENFDALRLPLLLVPLNSRLPLLEECDHETSSAGSDVVNQQANDDLEQPAVLNIQQSGTTEIVPPGVGISNSVEKSVEESSNSKIEMSLVTGGRDENFIKETNLSEVKVFELDRQEDSSKDSKESEDFHPLDPSKYKTELCRAFQIRGSCRYGTRCNYAHGLDQLKVSFHHGKYKTRNCQAYHETGYCRYGARCSFIHDLEEGILKCSIANKEILEALHHWPEDDSASSATVTWKVFNKRRGRACLDDTLIEFTAIPSIKPADLGPDCDMNNGVDNRLGASKVYTLEPNRCSVKQIHRPFRRNTSRFESADDFSSLKGKTNSNGITSSSGPRPEASVTEVRKSSADHASEGNKSNLVKCKDSHGVEKRQSMIRNSVKDLMTLIKAVEPRYSGAAPNSYSSRNLNFALPSVVSSRRSSMVDVTFGENFMEDGSIHASVSFRKEEHPRQTYLHGHRDNLGRGGQRYSRDCSRDSQFFESRPVLAKKRKCFSFHYKGFCLYGPDCQFLHDE